MNQLPPLNYLRRIFSLSGKVALLLLASSCAENLPEVPQEELYARGFIKQFGVPDPNHTWSMAAPVEASIKLPSNINGTAKFYTTAPEAPGCKLLAIADVNNGKAQIKFDVTCGTEMVYVRVANMSGITEYSGFITLEDNRLGVGTVESRTSDCRVTKDLVADYEVLQYPDNVYEKEAEFLKKHSDDFMQNSGGNFMRRWY